MKLVLCGRLVEAGLLAPKLPDGLDGLAFAVNFPTPACERPLIVHKTELVVGAPRPVVQAWVEHLYHGVTITVEVPDEAP